MKRLSLVFLVIGLFLFALWRSTVLSDTNVVNVYVWGGEVPDSNVAAFQKATGIKVNFSTYDSNETLYAKLKASKENSGYDVIEPSSYYLDRMRREGMVQVIDKSRLSNYANLDPEFLNQAYDPHSDYSIPFMWGVTGMFINTEFFPKNSLTSWKQLWNSQYKNKILLLDDPREVFAMALISLGYPANDADPRHVKQAYLALKNLMPNVRLFNSDADPSLAADSDVTIGMIWNGDLYNAQSDNSNLQFIYPKEGFVIWVDGFAIPKGAPHLSNAYKFIDFMLRGDMAAQATLQNNYATANVAAKKLLPPAITNSPIVYPSDAILKRGQFQTDINDQALTLYNHYWELLKVGA